MIEKLISPVSDLLSKVIEDKDKRAALTHEIATMAQRHAQEIALAQIDVNKQEAASASWFRGSWRPFIGWVCGVAFAYHFVGQPVILFALAITGTEVPTLPEFDMGTLLSVLGGLLGLGTLRTYEKTKGLK